ncbi:hypothetical protein BCV71DRAFT_244112 [Rhizopus microsporus]|uniref:Uncharacterized protein n=1 Tax=Rhizopus microsporus TaxID=58291 RepID=A0A1X0RZG6_RHIZD|nr:hypothetical protein BCV71DRAFT_244112 [Rhizopus microsporus]
MRPVAVGKQVVERDPFTYQKYPETPQSSPTLSSIDIDEAELTETSDSDNSIDSSIKLTKDSVLDFFACIASKTKPVANEEQFIYRHWSMEELVDLLNGYLTNVESNNLKTKVADWLAKDGRFGRSKMCRVGAATVRIRSLWVLKEEHRRDALNKVFNTLSYRKKVRETSGNWLTVGYCRKSKCNVSQEQRVKLIQRMVEILKVKCLCEKVYVSPICSASSLLFERDFSNKTATVMDKVKYKDGHFQDFVMLAKSSSYKFEILSRQQLLQGEVAKKFDCRTPPVKRSTL